LAGPGELIAHGDALPADGAALAPSSPATADTAGLAAVLLAPSSSLDGMLHHAVISTLADQASAFQRLANTWVILGPMNMAPA
jgi:hypothetical protein